MTGPRPLQCGARRARARVPRGAAGEERPRQKLRHMRRLCKASTSAATRQRRRGVVAVLALFCVALAWGDVVVKPALRAALVDWLGSADAAALPLGIIVVVGHTGLATALLALACTVRDDPGLAATTYHAAHVTLVQCPVCHVNRPLSGAHHCRVCDVCTC